MAGKTYIQYSKRLTTTITVFWCVFRFVCMVVLLVRPTLSEAVLGVLRGVDDVMMCNIGFYCGNSVAEKGIVGYFGRPKISETTDVIDG